MNKFIDYCKNNVVKIFILTIIVGCVVYVISDTYATTSYKIVFNRAENTEVMKTCKTDENGKLDNDCVSAISTVCSRWSLDPWYGSNTQSNQIQSSQFANMVFTADTNYYCVAGSSGTYNKGCYVCKDDPNIMKWKFNTNSDADCSSGYTKSSTITQEDLCVSIVPDSCYVCNSDNNVMKWDNNGDSDNNCSSGYSPIDKSQNECKTIIPDSCYVCNNDNNVMKWDNNGNSDDKCSSGYTSVNRPQNQCVIVENPKTGNILIFIVWILGLGSICYALYYFKGLKTNN